MNKKIEQMISLLFVDEEAKDVLRTADRILNSNVESVRSNVFVPLVVAGEGCGFSSFGRVFSAIVDASAAQSVRGSSSFLELVFPKDNERDENMFFASPRMAASVRNRFYGTMLISFKEYCGQDLIESDSLKNLMGFMEDNKSNIRFVLHITPEFSAKSRLKAALQNIVNIAEVHLEKPNADKSYSYVIQELKAQGVEIDDDAKKCIKEKALPRMVGRKSYSGYKSLNVFLRRLRFEAALLTDSGKCRINLEVLAYLLALIEKEEALSREEIPGIGFGV